MVLEGKRGKEVLAFTDDTSVGTLTEEDHLEALADVLDLIFNVGVRLKLSKCAFGVHRAKILGHVVDEDGIRPSDKHVKAIREFIEPGPGDELMRFFGLANYFADFVDHFCRDGGPPVCRSEGHWILEEATARAAPCDTRLVPPL